MADPAAKNAPPLVRFNFPLPPKETVEDLVRYQEELTQEIESFIAGLNRLLSKRLPVEEE